MLPFAAALLVALALSPLRLGGLSVLAAFFACAYFVSGLQLSPLTATRKILVLVVAAAAVGVLVDFAFKPNRLGATILAIAAAGAGIWAFWPLLVQKGGSQAWLLGGVTTVALALSVVVAQSQLAHDGLRAGSAALAMGLGTGIAAIFAASASYGLLGIALGVGAGGFLLPQMISGNAKFAGATFTYTAVVAAALVACGAMVLAQLQWYAVLVLALVPAATRLPAPRAAPAWLRAVLFSLYGFVVAGIACVLAWPSSQS